MHLLDSSVPRMSIFGEWVNTELSEDSCLNPRAQRLRVGPDHMLGPANVTLSGDIVVAEDLLVLIDCDFDVYWGDRGDHHPVPAFLIVARRRDS